LCELNENEISSHKTKKCLQNSLLDEVDPTAPSLLPFLAPDLGQRVRADENKINSKEKKITATLRNSLLPEVRRLLLFHLLRDFGSRVQST
jgi:hypothetical protein